MRALIDNPLRIETGRVRHSHHPLPRRWAKMHPGILMAADMQFTRHTRLSLKVLLMDTPASLQDLWRKKLDRGTLGKDCVGAVTRLSYVGERYSGGELAESYVGVDPRYYALMGLCRTHLTTEIIAHESLHAVCAYLARTRRPTHVSRAEVEGMPEEAIAYPLGKLVAQITGWLTVEGYEVLNHV
jgi:hypothetical protein